MCNYKTKTVANSNDFSKDKCKNFEGLRRFSLFHVYNSILSSNTILKWRLDAHLQISFSNFPFFTLLDLDMINCTHCSIWLIFMPKYILYYVVSWTHERMNAYTNKHKAQWGHLKIMTLAYIVWAWEQNFTM